MSDFFEWRVLTAVRRRQAKQLCKFFQGNPSLFPQELILPETTENWNFACKFKKPVDIGGCKITGLSISYPPDIVGEEIETALLGPDGLVYSSELGYDDVCRHDSWGNLLGHLRDLIRKLYASG